MTRVKVGEITYRTSVDTDELERFWMNLQNISRKPRSFYYVFRALFVYIRQREKLAFETKGASLGGPPWPALAPKYEKWKEKRFPGQPMLVLTGDMRDSLTKPDHPKAIREMSGAPYLHRAKFGTKLHRAAWHHQGREDRRNRDGSHNPLPQRVIIEDGPLIERELARLTRRYILAGLKDGWSKARRAVQGANQTARS